MELGKRIKQIISDLGRFHAPANYHHDLADRLRFETLEVLSYFEYTSCPYEIDSLRTPADLPYLALKAQVDFLEATIAYGDLIEQQMHGTGKEGYQEICRKAFIKCENAESAVCYIEEITEFDSTTGEGSLEAIAETLRSTRELHFSDLLVTSPTHQKKDEWREYCEYMQIRLPLLKSGLEILHNNVTHGELYEEGEQYGNRHL